MLSDLFSNPLSFVVQIFALLVAITVHEYSHALAADRLGDPTPRLAGRLSLNPLAHLDPIGTLMLLLIRLGWGKPVPIDPFNLRNPRRDSALVSLAGPASNLILAIFLSIILQALIRFFPLNYQLPAVFISVLLPPLIILNVLLAIFNLIPLHPLDGGKILVGFLPEDKAEEVDLFLSRYGTMLLILLIFPWFGTSLISSIIFPIVNFILSLLLPLPTLI